MASSGTASTSFQRKTRVKIPQILGTRPSLHNNQLLISSGIPSLDNLIGGGFAVGTVVLIEEDKYGSYSKMMLKYFLAEGVMNKHELFLTSSDLDPQDLLNELPAPLLDEPVLKTGQSTELTDDMKIAWRYKNLPQVQSVVSGVKFGHYYDLTKTMDPIMLETTNKTLLPLTDDICNKCGKLMKGACVEVLNSIQQTIEKGDFRTGTPQQHRNILRIGIHSFGSPQWGDDIKTDTIPSMCRFLYVLRALMRTTYAVCMITFPAHIFQDTSLPRYLQHLSDLAIRLESFTGSSLEKNPAFQEYHGLFHLLKLPRLNSLSCHMPDTMDLAFKLRKKRFMIEKLHLPPELSETVARTQDDDSVSCGSSTTNNKLDF
ncbi:hypothetical protein LSH36_204g10039 [Paralvinella palmiformis]|uniref:Elongator complex protein 4 n=1 Tax=Paralvinella palmiformis TaxID=53620 RepID=A0AAD9N648_9ANNE|nr:hypothetical protein LSH36_204g10039 [Paralvinella palmiformis]